MTDATQPKVSVILPNRDNEPALDLVLEKLAENTTYEPFEVVCVDDGSTDRSREILRRWRDSGRFSNFVLEEQEPSGVVVTLNRCLELATGDVIVQMDADASVETKGWVEKMLALLLVDDKVGAVTAKVVFDNGFAHAFGIDLLGPEGYHDRGTRVLEPVGQRTYHQRVERFPEEEAPGGDRVAEVDTGIGCCLMYRRADALSFGGYDLGYQPVWFDDMDLGLSFRKLGKKVFFTPDVRIIHRIGLRQTRAEPSGTRGRVIAGASKVAARVIDPGFRRDVGWRFKFDLPPDDIWARLQHHYGYWREKWGWDLLNPDLDSVRRRYAGSEVAWRWDEQMQAEGRRIIARYEAANWQPAPEFAAARAAHFIERFGFPPPPDWSVLQDYEHILDTIEERGLAKLDGDFVEVGVFLGGGVYQLARLLERHAPKRKVWAIDIFDPGTDDIATGNGVTMSGIYEWQLAGADQRQLYDSVVEKLRNVETLAGDSATVELPFKRIAFALIDGNHSPEYVRSDFERLWDKVVSGGVLAFDDYGFDLPDVTQTVDALRQEHADEIAEFWTAGPKTAFLRRR